MHFLGDMSGSRSTILGGVILGAAVDLPQEAGVAVAAVAAAVAIVAAGVGANLLKPNRNAVPLLDPDPGLFHPVPAPDHALCQDLDQDPDHHCHRVKNERVKAQKNAARVGAGAVVGARVYLGES